MTNRILTFIALITVTASYSSVNAAVIDTNSSCSNGTQMYGIDFTDVTYQSNSSDNCYGAYEGNNDSTLQIAQNTWSVVETYNVPSEGASGSINNFSVSFNNENYIGDWSYSGDTSLWDSFLIVTKASNNPGWAVYQFDNLDSTTPLNGSWYIPWSPNNNGKDNKASLSHIAIYSMQASNTVPEPTPLALLSIGLIALAFRKKK